MITVVTGNKGKAAEVAAFFDGIVEVTHTPFEAVEPQAENIADIDGLPLDQPRTPQMKFSIRLPKQVPSCTILRKSVDLSAK